MFRPDMMTRQPILPGTVSTLSTTGPGISIQPYPWYRVSRKTFPMDSGGFFVFRRPGIGGRVRYGQPAQGNATIGVVATNVILTKEQSFKMAAADQEGIALAVRPAHTMGDGDTMFAIPTGELQGGAHIDRLLAAVVVVTSRAITSGVRKAVGVQGLPAVSDLTEAQHG